MSIILCDYISNITFDIQHFMYAKNILGFISAPQLSHLREAVMLRNMFLKRTYLQYMVCIQIITDARQ